jgi:hypothetical protein
MVVGRSGMANMSAPVPWSTTVVAKAATAAKAVTVKEENTQNDGAEAGKVITAAAVMEVRMKGAMVAFWGAVKVATVAKLPMVARAVRSAMAVKAAMAKAVGVEPLSPTTAGAITGAIGRHGGTSMASVTVTAGIRAKSFSVSRLLVIGKTRITTGLARPVGADRVSPAVLTPTATHRGLRSAPSNLNIRMSHPSDMRDCMVEVTAGEGRAAVSTREDRRVTSAPMSV